MRRAIRSWHRHVTCSRLYRFLITRGYSSGKIALGEKNSYGIPGDWITVDLDDADFVLEFTERTELPFPTASQSFIYTSHLFEHLEPPALSRLIQECFRVLGRGDWIRIEVPDAEAILGAYRNRDAAFIGYFVDENQTNLVLKRGLPAVYGAEHVAILGLLSCYVADGGHVPVVADRAEFEAKMATLTLDEMGQWARSLQTPEQRRTHGHVNIMYFAKLEQLLRHGGFTEVYRRSNRETGVAGLRLDGIERKERAFYSLYVEARK